MKKTTIILAALLLAALSQSVSTGQPWAGLVPPAGAAEPVHAASGKQAALHDGMRELWVEHTLWTRLYIISATAGLADVDATTARLMQNQTDIGNALKPYYGEEAGNRLTVLLKEHIIAAAEVTAAAKAGDDRALLDAQDTWSKNADAIAEFLSGANPQHWPEAALRQMLHDHLSLTTAEVRARLDSDWAGDIAVFQQINDEIIHMADALSEGIVAQFPDRF